MKYLILTFLVLMISVNSSFSQSAIEDSDGDTHVDTDPAGVVWDDVIDFTLDGDLKWRMIDGRLEQGNASNLFLGARTGTRNTGTINTFVGTEAGHLSTTGHNNVALGSVALKFNETSAYNTAIGVAALNNYEPGSGLSGYCTALGNRAGENLESGFANTFLGADAAKYLTTGGYNCVIGMGAGGNKTAGDRNVILGYGANANGSTGSDNIFIGFQSARFETGSNKLYIENSSSSTPLIHGDFEEDELTVNGLAKISRTGLQSGDRDVMRLIGDDGCYMSFYDGNTKMGEIRTGFGSNDDVYLTNSSSTGSLVLTTNSIFKAIINPDGRAAFGRAPLVADNTQFFIEGDDARIGLEVQSGGSQEEVARFVSSSEPQITLYRGDSHAGDLQHYKQDLFLTNRANKGSVVVQTTNGGNTRVAASFYPDGDLDVTGDRIYFGNTEYLQDVGWRRIETNSSIQPSTCGNRDLGSSTNRWDQLYIDNAVLVASCFSSGGGSGSSALAQGRSDQYGLKEIMELKSVQGFKNKSNEITVTQLQEVMPALVEEYDEVIDEKTEKVTLIPSESPSIRITDFIPVLVKSEQEQQGIIEEQQQTIEMLKDKVESLLQSFEHLEKIVYNQESMDERVDESRQYTLLQNQPNPAYDQTVIFYSSSVEFTRGVIQLVNLQGETIQEHELNESQGAVSLNIAGLSRGNYFYSLIIDGKIVATKKMIIIN